MRTCLLEIQQRVEWALQQLDASVENTEYVPMALVNETTEESIRKCIAQLMEMKTTDKKGHVRPLSHKAAHWQAVYRILVDFDLGAADGDFKGFADWVPNILPDNCRIPFSYEALRGISKTLFVRPFAKWQFDNSYFRTRSPYDSMYQVAECFLQLLCEKGLVKR